jgi:hypothetical protein
VVEAVVVEEVVLAAVVVEAVAIEAVVVEVVAVDAVVVDAVAMRAVVASFEVYCRKQRTCFGGFQLPDHYPQPPLSVQAFAHFLAPSVQQASFAGPKD